MTKTSCVLLDLGGVLVNWSNSWLIDEISKKFQLSYKRLLEEFENNLDEYSSGKTDEIEFWHKIGKKITSSELEKVENSLYREICRRKMSLNQGVYGISKKLKEKDIKIGIVSNTEEPIFSIVREIMPMEHFDYQFLSYKIGLTKPDKKIFKHILENIPFNKEDILFIDDDIKNVESAKSFGIDSIQFTSDDELFLQLEKRHIL